MAKRSPVSSMLPPTRRDALDAAPLTQAFVYDSEHFKVYIQGQGIFVISTHQYPSLGSPCFARKDTTDLYIFHVYEI